MPKRPSTFVGALPTQFVESVPTTPDQRRTVAMAASLLLDYPGEAFVDSLGAVEQQLHALPEQVRTELQSFVDWVHTVGLRRVAEAYVDTFDSRRRCSLYLSYYAVGDTRQRGQAILAFQEELNQAGFTLARKELPDHLCVVLEACATAAPAGHDRLTELLAAHRDGIEVLRYALEQAASPYAHLVRAVCAVLPHIDEAKAQAFVDLIRQGPPAELVGAGSQHDSLPFPMLKGANL